MNQRISVNTVKIQNRATVFSELARRDTVTRIDLARKTNLSVGTVTTILEELSSAGIVVETKDTTTLVGRKPNLVRFVGDARTLVVVDLSSREFRYELLNVALESKDAGSHRYDPLLSFEENLEALCTSILARMEEIALPDASLIGVGIAVPGSYEQESDTIRNAPFPELEGVNLKSLFQRYFKHDIIIDHDVFLAATAEVKYLPDYQSREVFYLFLGEGVGGAVADEGTVRRGARSEAGDVGRMIMDGERTLEEVVSWNTLLAAADRIGISEQQDLVDALSDNREPFRTEISRIAHTVALAVYNVFWIVDPDTVILAGNYELFEDEFVNMVRTELESLIPQNVFPTLEVRRASLRGRSALVGAGERVRESWLNGM
ncbi:ROK family transcriptional regulator [Salinispira pacifica]